MILIKDRHAAGNTATTNVIAIGKYDTYKGSTHGKATHHNVF